MHHVFQVNFNIMSMDCICSMLLSLPKIKMKSLSVNKLMQNMIKEIYFQAKKFN